MQLLEELYEDLLFEESGLLTELILFFKSEKWNRDFQNQLRKGQIKENNKILNIIAEVMKKYDGNDVYISFRDFDTTTIINPKNQYDTPTGFYCYPLKPILTQHLQLNDWDEIKKIPMEDFFSSKLFPYKVKEEFVYIFHVSKPDNVLYTSKNDTTPIDGYLEKIEKLFSKNEEILAKIKEVKEKGQYFSDYWKKEVNGVRALWAIIYDIHKLLRSDESSYRRKASYFFTHVCDRIGVAAFVDDAGTSMIHSGEPTQAVFFKLQSVTDYREKLSKKYGRIYQRPISTNLSAQDLNLKHYRNTANFFNNLEKTLEKKYDQPINFLCNIREENEIAFELKNNIINGRPFIINIGREKNFKIITLRNRSFEEVDESSFIIQKTYPESLIYQVIRNCFKILVGDKINTSLEQVKILNEEYDNLIFIKNNGGQSYFVNSLGKPTVGNLTIDFIIKKCESLHSNQYLVAYCNTRNLDLLCYEAFFDKQMDSIVISKYGGIRYILDENFQIKELNPEINYNLKYIKDVKTRAAFYNCYKKTDEKVSSIDFQENSDIGIALYQGGNWDVIDIYGNDINVENYDLKTITDTQILRGVINKIRKNNNLDQHDNIGTISGIDLFDGRWGEDITLAKNQQGDSFFINTKGQKDISNINMDLISKKGNYVLTTYFRQKLKNPRLEIITTTTDEDVFLCSAPRSNFTCHFYMDNEGQIRFPKDYNLDEGHMKNEYKMSIYFNTLFKDPSYRVAKITNDGKYLLHKHMVADVKLYEAYFNINGEFDIPKNIDDSSRTAFFNSKAKEFKYSHVSKVFDNDVDNVPNLYWATTQHNVGNFIDDRQKIVPLDRIDSTKLTYPYKDIYNRKVEEKEKTNNLSENRLEKRIREQLRLYL